MLKSGNPILQLIAILLSLIIVFYGYIEQDIILFIGAIIIILIDTYLILKIEKCVPIIKPYYSLEIKSGNKFIQLLAVLFGSYVLYKYYHIPIVAIVALIFIIGDGYLLFYEEPVYCNF